jgi:hypothetical protein
VAAGFHFSQRRNIFSLSANNTSAIQIGGTTMKHMRISLSLFAIFLLATPVLAAEPELCWGDVYCFSQEELAPEAEATGVFITEVPEKALGTVLLGTRQILAGDVLPVDSLDQLTFTPASGAEGEAMLSCLSITQDGLGEATEMTIHIGSGKNEAPTAEDSQFETYKNISGEVPLKTADPEDDPLTVTIVKGPKRGTVEVSQDGTVTYTPKENKVGKDSFTYTVTDTAGNTSQEATVRIQIKKPSEQDTYADMADDPALLSATWLREAGIYEGELVAGQRLFQPEETVSRGEFIAMCMKLVGVDADGEALATGFADAAETPQWLEPYVSAALKSGYISGVSTDEGLMLQADTDITRGEAAVIVSNMLGLSEAETVMAEDKTVPAWAATAVAALRENGMFDASDTSAVLSRREAAELLYQVRQSENTLLSWAKES